MKNSYAVSINVGAKIRRERTALQMSGEQLGRQLGLSQQQISRYESGKSHITVDILFQISQLLNIPVNILLPDCFDIKRQR